MYEIVLSVEMAEFKINKPLSHQFIPKRHFKRMDRKFLFGPTVQF